MCRYFTLAVLGFAGLAMTAPQSSQAQAPVGVQVQVGPAAFTYQQGYPYGAPRYVVAAPTVVAPTTVVAAPVAVAPSPYFTWYWDGVRYVRHYRYYPHGHYIYHHR